MFPVYDLTGVSTDRPEMLGTKEKFWLTPIQGQLLAPIGHLFKIGRPGTGENWAEKVTCEIAKLVQLPCAHYDFAYHLGREGTISPIFLPENSKMLSANFMLGRVIDGYDDEKRFNQFEYRLHSVLNVLHRSALRGPLGCVDLFKEFTAVEMFIGYLFFDALTGNTDRHHENWGAILHGDPMNLYLAPTFDHASSLGRNETDEKRMLRLVTKDQRATVEAYAARARSAFFGSEGQEKCLLHSEVVRYISSQNKTISLFWANLFSGIPIAEFEKIFELIHPEIISSAAKDFALRVLACNQRMIRETVDAT